MCMCATCLVYEHNNKHVEFFALVSLFGALTISAHWRTDVVNLRTHVGYPRTCFRTYVSQSSPRSVHCFINVSHINKIALAHLFSKLMRGDAQGILNRCVLD